MGDKNEQEKGTDAMPLEQVEPPPGTDHGDEVMAVSRASWVEMFAEPAWKEEMIRSGRVVFTD